MSRSESGMPARRYSPTAPAVRALGIIALPASTGILLLFAFPPLDWTSLAWFALVPFAIALARPAGEIELYLGAYLGGLAFQLFTVDWLRTLYGGAGLSGPHATQWLIQGVLLAGFWPIEMLFGRLLVRKSRLPIAASLPLLWVSFEYARMHCWAIVDSTGLPWGQLGLTQWNNARLIQSADLAGVSAITAIVAGFNGLIIDAGRWFVGRVRREKSPFPAVSLIGVAVVLVFAWLYGGWQLSQVSPPLGPVVCLMPQQSLGVFTPSIAAAALDDAGINTAIQFAADESRDSRLRPNLLLWSEGAYPGILAARPSASSSDNLVISQDPRYSGSDSWAATSQNELFDVMAAFASRFQTALLIGGTRRTDTDADSRSDRYNTAIFIDPDLGFIGCYDKIWLVPFSEFQPTCVQYYDPLMPDRFARGNRYPVFPVRVTPSNQSYRMAVAICYDVCFPPLFRRYMTSPNGKTSPDFYAVPAHEAQDQTLSLQKSLLRQVQFRAIECRRAIVRNVAGGYSGIVDANGQIAESSPGISIDRPVLIGPVPIDARRSLYLLWGDFFPIGATLTTGVALLLSFRIGFLRQDKPTTHSAVFKSAISNIMLDCKRVHP